MIILNAISFYFLIISIVKKIHYFLLSYSASPEKQDYESDADDIRRKNANINIHLVPYLELEYLKTYHQECFYPQT